MNTKTFTSEFPEMVKNQVDFVWNNRNETQKVWGFEKNNNLYYISFFKQNWAENQYVISYYKNKKDGSLQRTNSICFQQEETSVVVKNLKRKLQGVKEVFELVATEVSACW